MSYRAYNNYQTQILDTCPFHRILLPSVGRALGGWNIVAGTCALEDLLFNKDVFDEAVDDAGVDWRIGLGPKHDARGRQDFEAVQHVVCMRGQAAI